MSDLPAHSLLRKDWLWLVAVWLLAAATLVWRSHFASAGAPLFLDTDDAMRLVQLGDGRAGDEREGSGGGEKNGAGHPGIRGTCGAAGVL